MATKKSNKTKKIKKPKTMIRPSRHAHALILEPNGVITCECDPFMIFAYSAGDAQKLSVWFKQVAEHLRDKNK